MSLQTDLKFAGNISLLVRNFKRKGDYLYNFSCPICGDSAKNRLRARGYIYRPPSFDGLKFKCHKCGRSESFSWLLQQLDPNAYREYIKEAFLDRTGQAAAPPAPEPKTYRSKTPSSLIGLPSMDSLPEDHSAKLYLIRRKIPSEFMKTLFYTDDFPALVDRLVPGHSYPLRKESRIIIPFLDRQRNLLAIQGRSLDPNAHVRYLTVKMYEDAPKIYGIERLEKSHRRIYIVEGPFDSMFLPNCLAVAGSDIPHSLPKDRVLVVYDNERKKPETCEKMEAAVERGYRICVWPKVYKSKPFRWKDINDMVAKGGMTPAEIRVLIDRNSYEGIEASVRIGQWRTG